MQAICTHTAHHTTNPRQAHTHTRPLIDSLRFRPARPPVAAASCLHQPLNYRGPSIDLHTIPASDRSPGQTRTHSCSRPVISARPPCPWLASLHPSSHLSIPLPAPARLVPPARRLVAKAHTLQLHPLAHLLHLPPGYAPPYIFNFARPFFHPQAYGRPSAAIR